ncbi:MAG: ROK family protein [Campylobacterales bacterium]|nr:ROK family protein [Campylobacterales bacterium]
MDSTLLADVGGTYFRYRLGEEEVVRSASKGWEKQLMGLLETHPQVRYVGIAFAGQVSEGKILSAPNVEVSLHNLKTQLEQRFPHLRVAVDNDLKCAALAYHRHLGSDSVAVLYAGSGLGSALISEGRIVRGHSNMAGEIGHVSYRPAPFRCGCGKNDCLELFASGSGIDKHREYYRLSERSLDEWRLSGSEAEQRTAEAAEEALVFAASLMITLHNPEYLVMGGGVLEHNPRLLERIRAAAAARTFSPAWKECRIVEADLDDAPLIGAGLLLQPDFWLK